MKLRLITLQIFLFLLIMPKVYSLELYDTLYICSGETIQLQTLPNQYSYQWFPEENISDLDTYNPIVTPTMTTIYTVSVEANPITNLIYNGDFSLGNTSFDSEYNYTADGTIQQGFYGIFSSPTQFNSWFTDCSDHSNSSDDLMLVVDGATDLGKYVWCQQIGIEQNTDYVFSSWLNNVFWELPSLIQFSINGIPIGSNFQIAEQNCLWEEFSANWFSGSNTSANICIESLSTDVSGNDFAVDDITFQYESEGYVDTFLVVVLENSFSQIDTAICANESIIFAGVEVQAGTQDTIFKTSFSGCDSLIFVTVNSIDTSYIESRVDTLCAGDTLYYLGITITEDTSICDIYTNYLGCDSSVCFVVYFLSEKTISVNQTSPSCFGDVDGIITATPFAGLPPFEYLWSTSATVPTVENLAAGFYTVTITDANSCIAIKEIELKEPSMLSVAYSLTETSCFGAMDGSANFSISGGTPEYFISIGDELFFNNNFIENMAGGNYSILVEDIFGCSSEFEITIEQPDPLLISLPPQETLPLGHTFEITPVITANSPYQVKWFPTINLSCSSCENPTVSPIEDINYQITVEDSYGCTISDTIEILIQNNYELYVPNAFSPNGDGVNDYFELYPGKGVAKIMTFKIFNRWGALVFEKNNFIPGNREDGWDGTFNSTYSDSGVYAFFSEVLFIDGDVKIFAGDVLLIK